MKTSGGGFEQCYNGQAVVDSESLLILAPHLTQAGNDKEHVVPMLDAVQALPEGLNQPQQLLADTGYFSANNVDACHCAQNEPLIAAASAGYHHDLRER